MKPKTRVVLTMFFAALICAGCAGAVDKPPKEPVKTKKKKVPKYDERTFHAKSFGVLPQATLKPSLPYLGKADGAPDQRKCYLSSKDLIPWKTSLKPVRKKLEGNTAAVEKALLAWIQKNLGGEDPSGTNGWTVEYGEPWILHSQLDRVRLDEAQECINDKSGALPANARTVTTLFGAKEFTIKTPEPLEKKRIKEIKKLAAKLKMAVKPVRDKKSGSKKSKRPANRPCRELNVKTDSPLYFAFADMPDDAWAKEYKAKACNLFLVYDDAIPRVPDCDELTEAGFGVSKGEKEGEVLVKVTADNVTREKSIPFGQVTMIQAGGRVVVWVKPDEVEEGAHLNVNSLVLDPGGGPEDALNSLAPQKGKKKRKRKKRKPPKPDSMPLW